jgi:hypothetical protein
MRMCGRYLLLRRKQVVEETDSANITAMAPQFVVYNNSSLKERWPPSPALTRRL